MTTTTSNVSLPSFLYRRWHENGWRCTAFTRTGRILIWLARKGMYRYWNWPKCQFLPYDPSDPLCQRGTFYVNCREVSKGMMVAHSLFGLGYIHGYRLVNGDYVLDRTGDDFQKVRRWGIVRLVIDEEQSNG